MQKRNSGIVLHAINEFLVRQKNQRPTKDVEETYMFVSLKMDGAKSANIRIKSVSFNINN